MKNSSTCLRWSTVLMVALISIAFGCSNSDETPQSEKSTKQASSGTSGDMTIEQDVSPELLRQAAFNGKTEVIEMGIRQGTVINEADGMGRTALMLAAFNGHSAIVEQLLEEGANIKVHDNMGRTPLIFAASGPYPDTVELLLEWDANPNTVDSEEGWSPLMFAAAEGNHEVVQVLLDYGADKSLKDKDGETALDFAQNNNHNQVVELLEGS